MRPAAVQRAGFTLLELLVVVGMLGILLAVGTPSYLGWIASTQARGAAAVLAGQIQRVRTDAKRGTPQQIVLTEGSPTFTAGGRTVTLEGATIQTSGTLTFQPPYGTLPEPPSSPLVFTVRSTRNASKTRTVRVISVMGRVVVQ